MQQKIEKRLFFSKTNASESVLINCPYKDKDTFHGRPMC